MFKKTTIRLFSAVVIMLVFSLSITPKKFLHDLVADHQDDVSIAINDGHDHIDHHGFNCNCDNLVATSPFAEHTETLAFNTPVYFKEYSSTTPSGIKSITHSFSALRGPPSLA